MQNGSTRILSSFQRTPIGPAYGFLRAIWAALGGEERWHSGVAFAGEGDLPSLFAVSDLAAASMGGAALAVAELVGTTASQPAAVSIDRRLASFWFGMTIQPEGWALPPLGDPIAGDYATADGWIRLHTNAPHHRDAALDVLGVPGDKAAVSAAVGHWQADALEAAVIARGGCAGAMRSMAAWAEHPQGKAVAAEPLVWSEATESTTHERRAFDPARPLAGVRVLDLTRILAGPVATRFLAGFGADVLRIDPPGWDEPGVAPEVTLGKRCARLDLRNRGDRDHLVELLADADVIVHGYRPGALEQLGLGGEMRQRVRPGIIDVSLDAYGWTGPWAGRRGFDSLVQMSSGIAHEAMIRFGKDRPTPLPVQALDHATGYFMAAAAVRGLTRRMLGGVGLMTRVSLARTAALLTGFALREGARPLGKPEISDFDERIEATAWGPARRMRPPVAIDGAAMQWDRPATALGSSLPSW